MMAASAKDLQLRELKDTVSQLKMMISEQTELINSLREVIDTKSEMEQMKNRHLSVPIHAKRNHLQKKHSKGLKSIRSLSHFLPKNGYVLSAGRRWN